MGDAIRRAEVAGLSWPLPEGLDERVLEARLFPGAGVPAPARRAMPQWVHVHAELRRKGVTLSLPRAARRLTPALPPARAPYHRPRAHARATPALRPTVLPRALNAENRRDLLDLLEDRYASRSTLVTSQLPLAQWHELLGDPTLADAILDRLVHNAYKLELNGGSMRKHHAGLTQPDHCTA